MELQRIDPKLEAVLARLCAQLGPLYKTHAVKLPYLVDVVAQHALGRGVTNGTHETWELGVVTREAYRFISHSEGCGPVFRIEPHGFSEGGKKISLVSEPPEARLTPEELEVVDFVAESYGRMPAEQLGQLTKRLNTELPTERWGSNSRALVDEEAYLRLDQGWQDLAEALTHTNLDDRSRWSEPVEDDPLVHLRRALDG